MSKKKGYFSISAVAKMFSVHQQTIRLYEREGLISPKRSEGNTRMFTEEDVDRLEEVIYLTHKLGINLAGVEMILKLQRQIKKMQKDMNKVFDSTQEELSREVEQSKKAIEGNANQLLSIRKASKAVVSQPNETEEPQTVDIDSWEIEYED
jgi:MerR family transcriptional regulator, heat shock protein HspR